MNRDDFLRMFAYDDWANRECLRALRAGADTPSASAAASAARGAGVGRMAHILSAKNPWLERIRRVPQSLVVWPASTIQECEALLDKMATAWREYFTNLEAEALEERVE